MHSGKDRLYVYFPVCNWYTCINKYPILVTVNAWISCHHLKKTSMTFFWRFWSSFGVFVFKISVSYMIDYHMAMSVFFWISFILFTVCHAYIAKEYVLLIDIFKWYQILFKHIFYHIIVGVTPAAKEWSGKSFNIIRWFENKILSMFN